MTSELTVLVLAALLQMGQMVLAAHLMTRQHGAAYNASPRDEQRPVTGMAGRAERAYRNHFEALAFFTVAALALVLADKTTGLTAALAWIYLGARILYVPAYVLGWSPWRSLIFGAGFIATLGMLLMALI